jgi:hypothetical protein
MSRESSVEQASAQGTGKTGATVGPWPQIPRLDRQAAALLHRECGRVHRSPPTLHLTHVICFGNLGGVATKGEQL